MWHEGSVRTIPGPECDSECSCRAFTLNLQNKLVLRDGLAYEEVCLPRGALPFECQAAGKLYCLRPMCRPLEWVERGGRPRFLAIKSEGECRTEGLLTHFFIFRPLHTVGFNGKKTNNNYIYTLESSQYTQSGTAMKMRFHAGLFFMSSRESGTDLKGAVILFIYFIFFKI